jgi:hypothetical protein
VPGSPEPEVCDDGIDNNCDGQVDEGCEVCCEEGPPLASITIPDNQSSTFEVSLVDVTNNVWTYFVEEISGRSLSHWVIGIPECLVDHIVSVDLGPGTEVDIGPDPSADGFHGIKWDLPEGFTEGSFSFELDGDYDTCTIEALVKAGPGHATGAIAGPICECVEPSLPDGARYVIGALGCVTGIEVRPGLVLTW